MTNRMTFPHTITLERTGHERCPIVPRSRHFHRPRQNARTDHDSPRLPDASDAIGKGGATWSALRANACSSSRRDRANIFGTSSARYRRTSRNRTSEALIEKGRPISRSLMVRFGGRAIRGAKVGPVDVGSQFLAANCSVRSALDLDTSLSRYLPRSGLPLADDDLGDFECTRQIHTCAASFQIALKFHAQ